MLTPLEVVGPAAKTAHVRQHRSVKLFVQRHITEIAIAVVLAVIFATGPPWWFRYFSRESTDTSPGKAPASGEPGSASPIATWTDLPDSSWRTFGIAQSVPETHGVMRVTFGQKLNTSNKWAGLIANVPTSCDYSIRMRARVLNLRGALGGYGVASGRLDGRSQPQGTAFQYDFGFGGYRALDYPDDWRQPYQYVDAPLNDRWHDIEVVFRSKMTAYVDGRIILSRSSLGRCGVPIIRIWSAAVEVRDVEIKTATA